MTATAVEWLVEKMLTTDWYTYKSLEFIEQAKEMEKQQIIDAVDWGNRKGYDEHRLTCINDEDERYYNQTFKKK